MKQTVADVMTPIVVQLPDEATMLEAARTMRDRQIGDVVVTSGGRLAGLATDRDLVIRGIAEDKDPSVTRLAEVITTDIVTIEAGAPATAAARLMRERAVRRLVVIDGDGAVAGVVSLGDLAAELDPDSALGRISTAPPTN